jgi:hypothetical protein
MSWRIMKTLIITGWGPAEYEYGCAAAVFLRKHPDADVAAVSMRRLPEFMSELATEPVPGHNKIFILGVGLGRNPDLLSASLKELKDKKVDVVFITVLDPDMSVPGQARKFLKVCYEDTGSLLGYAAKYCGVPASGLEKFVDTPHKKTADMARFLLPAAMWCYRCFQDSAAFPAAVRTLAGGKQPDSAQENMIAQYKRYGHRELKGKSGKALELLEIIKKVAGKDRARVMIFGETGTGKETVANMIHLHSRRKAKPFIPFNCASCRAEGLFESRLFGHLKGAFTGAHETREGAGLPHENEGGFSKS